MLDGRYWLIGDVRIDGRDELIAELAKHGPPPQQGNTDEELLVQAWRVWGQASLQRVTGDFSFALRDATRNTLWCARDFVGARPLYYAQVGKIFAFSNSLQILRAIPEISSNLNEVYIADFLLHGISREPSNTVYHDIHRLPPGHLLQFSEAGLIVKRFMVLPIVWLADIAALVWRHPELDWQRAKQNAADVGALRMLYLALQLSESVLGTAVPAPMAADVAADAPVRSLCVEVARWLPQAGFAPPALWERAAFRMSMRGGGVAGLAYLLRLSLSPTDEDWQKGAEDGRWWLWDALLRPLRLIRKYGQGR